MNVLKFPNSVQQSFLSIFPQLSVGTLATGQMAVHLPGKMLNSVARQSSNGLQLQHVPLVKKSGCGFILAEGPTQKRVFLASDNHREGNKKTFSPLPLFYSFGPLSGLDCSYVQKSGRRPQPPQPRERESTEKAPKLLWKQFGFTVPKWTNIFTISRTFIRNEVFHQHVCRE
jgi:hypothetical protein